MRATSRWRPATQESNWAQASWHSVPGRSGNPLIASYYGSSDTQPIDYSSSDCGYGIGQITDGMQLGPGQTLPTDMQVRVAVDYATNVAAAVRILQEKWVQLHQLGITMNNDDPTKAENWYAAIWAYNRGVHQGSGYQGLGWFNNPANMMYPVRHTFLHSGTTTTLDDASQPNDWPYQERVFGWMEVPLTGADGFLDYRGTYDWDSGVGSFLSTPGPTLFCSLAISNCDPAQIGTGNDPCPSENGACYWNAPVTWADCATQCINGTVTDAPNGHTYHTPPGDPEPHVTPASASCDLSATSPGAGAIVVSDETGFLPVDNPGQRSTNLMECPQTGTGLIPAASYHATFEIEDAQDQDALTSPDSLAALDVHQIGGGLGGHGVHPGRRRRQRARDLRGHQFDRVRRVRAEQSRQTHHQQGQLHQPVGQRRATTCAAAPPRRPLRDPRHARCPSPCGPRRRAMTRIRVPTSVSAPSRSCRYRPGLTWRSATRTPPVRGVQIACSGSDTCDLAGVPDNVTHSSCGDANPASAGSAYYDEPTYQTELLRALAPRLVTVTIGGNDIGFANIVATCLEDALPPKSTTCKSSFVTPFGDQVDQDIQNLATAAEQALYQVIYAVGDPSKVVLMEYASPISTGWHPSCIDLSQPDRIWLRPKVDELGSVLAQAAAKASLQFDPLGDKQIKVVDPRGAFSGHEACSSQPYISAPVLTDLVPTLDGPDILDNFYHPNLLGQARLEQALANAMPNP